MVDEAMWDRAMALLDTRDAQCNQLIALVKERDAYLEKAVGLIRDKDSALTKMHQNNLSLTRMLKAVAENPELLHRPECQALLEALPSTH